MVYRRFVTQVQRLNEVPTSFIQCVWSSKSYLGWGLQVRRHVGTCLSAHPSWGWPEVEGGPASDGWRWSDRQKGNDAGGRGPELRWDWMTEEEAAISMWGQINWGVKWKVLTLHFLRLPLSLLSKKGCRFMWQLLCSSPCSHSVLSLAI